MVEAHVNVLNDWGFAAAISIILLIITILILAAFSKVINFDRIAGRT